MIEIPENQRIVRTLHLKRWEVCRLITLLDTVEDDLENFLWIAYVRDKLVYALAQYDRVRDVMDKEAEHDS